MSWKFIFSWDRTKIDTVLSGFLQIWIHIVLGEDIDIRVTILLLRWSIDWWFLFVDLCGVNAVYILIGIIFYMGTRKLRILFIAKSLKMGRLMLWFLDIWHTIKDIYREWMKKNLYHYTIYVYRSYLHSIVDVYRHSFHTERAYILFETLTLKDTSSTYSIYFSLSLNFCSQTNSTYSKLYLSIFLTLSLVFPIYKLRRLLYGVS